MKLRASKNKLQVSEKVKYQVSNLIFHLSNLKLLSFKIVSTEFQNTNSMFQTAQQKVAFFGKFHFHKSGKSQGKKLNEFSNQTLGVS